MKDSSKWIMITGGKYRGRKLLTPGGKTHPMGSRERLALFNMLGGKIKGASVLDAFAGSGALGIEALSRGASKVVFVDKSPEAVQAIKANLAELEIHDGVKMIRGAFPQVELSDFGFFDVILADPPYDDFVLAEVESLAALLKSEGMLALSHPDLAPKIGGLELIKTRQYAAAHLSIYTKN